MCDYPVLPYSDPETPEVDIVIVDATNGERIRVPFTHVDADIFNGFVKFVAHEEQYGKEPEAPEDLISKEENTDEYAEEGCTCRQTCPTPPLGQYTQLIVDAIVGILHDHTAEKEKEQADEPTAKAGDEELNEGNASASVDDEESVSTDNKVLESGDKRPEEKFQAIREPGYPCKRKCPPPPFGKTTRAAIDTVLNVIKRKSDEAESQEIDENTRNDNQSSNATDERNEMLEEYTADKKTSDDDSQLPEGQDRHCKRVTFFIPFLSQKNHDTNYEKLANKDEISITESNDIDNIGASDTKSEDKPEERTPAQATDIQKNQDELANKDETSITESNGIDNVAASDTKGRDKPEEETTAQTTDIQGNQDKTPDEINTVKDPEKSKCGCRRTCPAPPLGQAILGLIGRKNESEEKAVDENEKICICIISPAELYSRLLGKKNVAAAEKEKPIKAEDTENVKAEEDTPSENIAISTKREKSEGSCRRTCPTPPLGAVTQATVDAILQILGLEAEERIADESTESSATNENDATETPIDNGQGSLEPNEPKKICVCIISPHAIIARLTGKKQENQNTITENKDNETISDADTSHTIVEKTEDKTALENAESQDATETSRKKERVCNDLTFMFPFKAISGLLGIKDQDTEEKSPIEDSGQSEAKETIDPPTEKEDTKTQESESADSSKPENEDVKTQESESADSSKPENEDVKTQESESAASSKPENEDIKTRENASDDSSKPKNEDVNATIQESEYTERRRYNKCTNVTFGKYTRFMSTAFGKLVGRPEDANKETEVSKDSDEPTNQSNPINSSYDRGSRQHSTYKVSYAKVSEFNGTVHFVSSSDDYEEGQMEPDILKDITAENADGVEIIVQEDNRSCRKCCPNPPLSDVTRSAIQSFSNIVGSKSAGTKKSDSDSSLKSSDTKEVGPIADKEFSTDAKSKLEQEITEIPKCKKREHCCGNKSCPPPPFAETTKSMFRAVSDFIGLAYYDEEKDTDEYQTATGGSSTKMGVDPGPSTKTNESQGSSTEKNEEAGALEERERNLKYRKVSKVNNYGQSELGSSCDEDDPAVGSDCLRNDGEESDEHFCPPKPAVYRMPRFAVGTPSYITNRDEEQDRFYESARLSALKKLLNGIRGEDVGVEDIPKHDDNADKGVDDDDGSSDILETSSDNEKDEGSNLNPPYGKTIAFVANTFSHYVGLRHHKSNENR